jgi:hypothetical protein
MLNNKFLVAAFVITWLLQLGYLARLLILSQQLKHASTRMLKK